MEELYMAMIKFFSAYGWQMTVLAVSGIFLLGVLKSVKAFDWIKIYSVIGEEKTLQVDKTKQLKKVAYTVISAGLSIAACCVYLWIIDTRITITLVASLSGTIWSMNIITYTLYENLGVRAVWKSFLNWAKNLILSTTAQIKEKIAAEKARIAAKKAATEATISETATATQIDITVAMQAVADYLGIETAYLEMLKKLKK
ncbi:MAG: hypothetical protein M0R31_06375 [Candidatus Riflebacteria bacterium]|nr:hypothetical protein [Candidatus Riflebacteria bacterium]